MIHPGFDIRPTEQPMGFAYGPGAFGPEVELRALNAIRKSLRDPDCEGPDPVYSIAMDVGRSCDREVMLKRNLLYGAVTYAGGRLGQGARSLAGARPRRQRVLRHVHPGGLRDLGGQGRDLYAGARWG